MPLQLGSSAGIDSGQEVAGVRGDLALHARLLLRRPGLAGVTAVVAGGTLVVAGVLPWARVLSTVRADGQAGTAVAATWSLLPGTVGGWVLAATAALAGVVGASVALDRPPHRAPLLLVGTAVVALSAVTIEVLLATPSSRLAGDLEDLDGLADRMPVAVELEAVVASGPGPWWFAGAVVLLVIAAFGSRDG